MFASFLENFKLFLNAKKEHFFFLNILWKGGWTMIPLFLLSVYCLYIIINRYYLYAPIIKKSSKYLESITQSLEQNKNNQSKKYFYPSYLPIVQMISQGTKICTHIDELEKCMETIGRSAIFSLEKKIYFLGTISGIAPMIGFLGTVLGMIKSFIIIANATHTVAPQMLSNGIHEAMITTATGLTIGIIAQLFYNYFVLKIQLITQHTTDLAQKFIFIWKKKYSSHLKK